MLQIVTDLVKFCNKISCLVKFLKRNILYIYKSIKNTEHRQKMAFLMLLCQKMKLQREENRLTLEQVRFTSKVSRMENKVSKRQKYYDKLKKQLERQATYYKNNANMFFSNMAGLGVNSVNLNNPYGSNGATQLALQNMGPDEIKDILNKASQGQCTLPLEDEALLNLLKTGVTQAPYDTKDGDGNEIKKGDIINSWTGKKVELPSGVEPEAVNKAASILQNMASAKVTGMQTQASQMKSCYENNVSIWLEAQQEQLEAQEEWEMDLLHEEQADMEAEKELIDAKIKRIQEQRQAVQQALGQAIQDSSPKFGLG